MPKVSILIPTYNAAPFVGRCLTSLMAQTFADFEVVVVDDGSVDGTMDVVIPYTRATNSGGPVVRCVRRSHHDGVAMARTVALDHAAGDYVGWVDADDWVEPEFVERLYGAAVQADADIAACGVVEHRHGARPRARVCIYPEQGPLYLERLYTKVAVDDAMLWNKLFRRQMLDHYAIRPLPGIDIGEDFNFCVQAFCRAGRVTYVDAALYHYHFRPTSLTGAIDPQTAWEQGQRNLDGVCGLLSRLPDGVRYRLTCNYLKFTDKLKFRHLYAKRPRAFYMLYREAYDDIMAFVGFPLGVRLKWRVIYGSLFAYRLYHMVRG